MPSIIALMFDRVKKFYKICGIFDILSIECIQMSTKKKSKKKAPKIILEKKSVFILTSAIVIMCIILLFVNALFSDPVSSEPVHVEQVNIESVSSEPVVAVPVQNEIPKVTPAEEKVVAVKPKAESHVPKVKPNPYSIPKASAGAAIAFIIDDAGHSEEKLKRYTSLAMPLTIAVLPGLEETEQCASRVVKDGKELILHQPMQAENLSVNPGPGAITPGMSLGEIKSVVRKNLAQLGTGVKGLNNHEGSLITEDEVRIGAVIDAAIEYGVYFLDSRTTAQTKAESAAAIRGIKINHRDIFIDNIIDKKDMAEQICKGLAIANKNGKAIMIGHVDKSVDVLPDLLLEIYPYLIEKGYKVTVPSQLK